MDDFNRELLGNEVGFSLPSERVIRTLEQIAEGRAYPKFLRVDNGPEFISHKLQTWCAEHNVILSHIEPGKPTQNGHIERLNRTYREDILDQYLLESLKEVRALNEQWLTMYNGSRPHSALGRQTPWQFMASKIS